MKKLNIILLFVLLLISIANSYITVFLYTQNKEKTLKIHVLEEYSEALNTRLEQKNDKDKHVHKFYLTRFSNISDDIKTIQEEQTKIISSVFGGNIPEKKVSISQSLFFISELLELRSNRISELEDELKQTKNAICLFGCVSTINIPLESQITDLKSQVADLKSQVANLESQITDFRYHFSNLRLRRIY